MPVADRFKGAIAPPGAARRSFQIIHVSLPVRRAIKRNVKRKLKLWGTSMLRLALALAIAAPLLSGCIIVATDKPTTRVVQTTPAETN